MAPSSSRPATTGYERLSQADALLSESDDDDEHTLARSFASLQPASAPRYAPIVPPRPQSGMATPKATAGASASVAGSRPKPRRRMGSGSGVDLKAINARLERWADEIASRFRRGTKGRGPDEERLEIHHSVFQAPEGVRPLTPQTLAAAPRPSMSRGDFDDVVASVRTAIAQGVHPRMISQGSSGSYFARNPEGKVVGVFKPKDEEPYAAGNPKWNKWIHRNLFPCFFGRACLIPNLSYISEAAAYTLDCQLQTHMVPPTQVVWLSSKSFHYPFWDRRRFTRNKKPLPEKAGSFQVFLKGFKDANIFLREHPWPDQYWSGVRTNDAHRRRRRSRWADNCRPGSGPPLDDIESEEDDDTGEAPLGPDNFGWTEGLKQAFREELEKLVILDYIMRNTDRGLDNWMIKVDWDAGAVSIASDPVRLAPVDIITADDDSGPRPVTIDGAQAGAPSSASYPSYQSQQPMRASGPARAAADPAISIGAIDNSLSWPWKHPDAWRSFPFGWLFLPVDLIGRPFSQKTRDHFLPLLTSTHWWSQTQHALREVFQTDPDFQERMFLRQMAVMKGQAWNVVETLKLADHGPLELTRRAKVCVWDDLVDVPIAVPMRMSSELRGSRATTTNNGSANYPDDDGDIGASAALAPAHGRAGDVDDLLGLTTPPADMPHPGRFDLSTSPPAGDGHSFSPPHAEYGGPGGTGLAKAMSGSRPRMPSNSAVRASYQGPMRSSLNAYVPARHQGVDGSPRHQRRYSYTTAAGRRNSSSIAQQLRAFGHHLDDDGYEDVHGDLGYAAAEGMEGNQRKVIVERLEPVKARNPVFTWC